MPMTLGRTTNAAVVRRERVSLGAWVLLTDQLLLMPSSAETEACHGSSDDEAMFGRVT